MSITWLSSNRFTQKSTYIFTQYRTSVIIIIYIYHALINALSAHMLHINPNIIFYKHVEHSPTKTTHTKHHTEKQTTPPPKKNKKNNYFKCVYDNDLYQTMHTCARAHTPHTMTVAETGYWHQLGRKYCEKRTVIILTPPSLHLHTHTLNSQTVQKRCFTNQERSVL